MRWLVMAGLVAAATPVSAEVARPVQALLDKASALDAQGKTGAATAEIEAALKLAERTAPNSETHAAALGMLAQFLAGFDGKRALALAEQAATIQSKVFGADDMRTLQQLQTVALLKGITGDSAGQVTMLGDVLARMTRAANTSQEREIAAVAHASYAMTLVKAGREPEAKREVATALATLDGPPAGTSTTAGDGFVTVAGLELRWGQYDAAARHAAATIGIGKRALGVMHPDLLSPMQYRAEALLRGGRFIEAEAQYREALAICDRADPPIPVLKFRLMKSLARYYMMTGQYAPAARILDQSVALLDTLEKTSDLRVTTHSDRANALFLSGNAQAAEAAARAGLAAARAIQPGSVNNASAAFYLAAILTDTKRGAEARPFVAEGVAIQAKLYPAEAWERGAGAIAEGDLADAIGDRAGAVAAYSRAVALLAASPAGDANRVAAAARNGKARMLNGDVAGGWPLSRDAADRLTGQLGERGRVATSPAVLSPNERGVYDSALDVAWARSRFH